MKCTAYLSTALSVPVAGLGKKKVGSAAFVAAGLADGMFIHETIDGRLWAGLRGNILKAELTM